jgi:hypothetical protein
MDIKDVKIGMRVKSAGEIEEEWASYVYPNTCGIVRFIGGNSISVKWDSSKGGDDDIWWINPEYIEPVYKKSEMVGNYIRVLRDDDRWFKGGEVFKVHLDYDKDLIISDDEGDYYSWAEDLPDGFTQLDLKNVYNGDVDLEYVLKEDVEKSKQQTKTEPNVKLEIPKQAIKNVKSQVIKSLSNTLSDKPIINESKDELIIYCGKNTIYYNKQLDILGMSKCHENDTYSQLTGLAIAHYRAYHKEDK